jgi:myo-inositol 2-dehydrogenase/D-chiro-inositol 1-dehydrogenase
LYDARHEQNQSRPDPLCLTLEQADEMIATCKAHNCKLMYAEELCFAPKYDRVRQLVREGAVGSIYYMRQCERHSGPHSDWFYDLDQSGGGALMDMGCHGLAWFRWILGPEKRAVSVYAQMQRGLVHVARTRCEEHSLREKGYGYAMEKAGSTRGWTFTNFEEAFNQGYPQELQHFIQCVRNDTPPLTTGEDGRAVLEILNAAYYSARIGQKVSLPFHPAVSRPIDLWLGPANDDVPATRGGVDPAGGQVPFNELR